MPIDPRISLGVQPVQLQMPDPNQGMNALARALQIKSAMAEGDMNALKMQEYQSGVERKNKLYSLMGQDYANPEDREAALLKGGFVSEYGTLTKDRREAEKSQAATQKDLLETALKKTEHMSSMLSIATPQNWPTVRSVVKAQLGQDLPEQFDPGWVAASVAGGQTLTQRLQAEHQRLTLAETGRHNLSTEAETGRHNKATEGIQGGQLAETKRHNKETEGAAAQAVTYQQDANGNFVALPSKVAPGQVVRSMPVAAPGAGLQPLAGKPSAATEKELLGISQQRSIVRGAIDAVKANPDAFSFARGAATMSGPMVESVAGRFDTDAQRQARSYLFNNVSKVINERAGAAQSTQELARLRSFLPAETDNAEQIVSKMEAFDKYLNDLEAGTRKSPAGAPTASPAGMPSASAIDAELARRAGKKL